MDNHGQPATLSEALARYRFAYLLTSAGDKAPHAVAVEPQFQDGVFVVPLTGRHSRANVATHPAVGLVWPPQEAGDYSLIVDGRADVADETCRITPTRAVLQRSGPIHAPAVPGGCVSDCVELDFDPTATLA